MTSGQRALLRTLRRLRLPTHVVTIATLDPEGDQWPVAVGARLVEHVTSRHEAAFDHAAHLRTDVKEDP